ncbi:hypothetical protein GDO86_011628 [Hymenochirus boettgeri]|uniref:Protein TOPAZ1 n=1 Tax=Hymenochirus boettgeri TaxID=247094 RepID=A0A8T2JCI0_9PIPI|nr:hypothetical protein GDO86_011628 [Hymenochirus boettgeri]
MIPSRLRKIKGISSVHHESPFSQCSETSNGNNRDNVNAVLSEPCETLHHCTKLSIKSKYGVKRQGNQSRTRKKASKHGGSGHRKTSENGRKKQAEMVLSLCRPRGVDRIPTSSPCRKELSKNDGREKGNVVIKGSVGEELCLAENHQGKKVKNAAKSKSVALITNIRRVKKSQGRKMIQKTSMNKSTKIQKLEASRAVCMKINYVRKQKRTGSEPVLSCDAEGVSSIPTGFPCSPRKGRMSVGRGGNYGMGEWDLVKQQEKAVKNIAENECPLLLTNTRSKKQTPVLFGETPFKKRRKPKNLKKVGEPECIELTEKVKTEQKIMKVTEINQDHVRTTGKKRVRKPGKLNKKKVIGLKNNGKMKICGGGYIDLSTLRTLHVRVQRLTFTSITQGKGNPTANVKNKPLKQPPELRQECVTAKVDDERSDASNVTCSKMRLRSSRKQKCCVFGCCASDQQKTKESSLLQDACTTPKENEQSINGKNCTEPTNKENKCSATYTSSSHNPVVKLEKINMRRLKRWSDPKGDNCKTGNVLPQGEIKELDTVNSTVSNTNCTDRNNKDTKTPVINGLAKRKIKRILKVTLGYKEETVGTTACSHVNSQPDSSLVDAVAVKTTNDQKKSDDCVVSSETSDSCISALQEMIEELNNNKSDSENLNLQKESAPHDQSKIKYGLEEVACPSVQCRNAQLHHMLSENEKPSRYSTGTGFSASCVISDDDSFARGLSDHFSEQAVEHTVNDSHKNGFVDWYKLFSCQRTIPFTGKTIWKCFCARTCVWTFPRKGTPALQTTEILDLGSELTLGVNATDVNFLLDSKEQESLEGGIDKADEVSCKRIKLDSISKENPPAVKDSCDEGRPNTLIYGIEDICTITDDIHPLYESTSIYENFENPWSNAQDQNAKTLCTKECITSDKSKLLTSSHSDTIFEEQQIKNVNNNINISLQKSELEETSEFFDNFDIFSKEPEENQPVSEEIQHGEMDAFSFTEPVELDVNTSNKDIYRSSIQYGILEKRAENNYSERELYLYNGSDEMPENFLDDNGSTKLCESGSPFKTHSSVSALKNTESPKCRKLLNNLDVVKAYEDDVLVLDVIQDDPDLYGFFEEELILCRNPVTSAAFKPIQQSILPFRYCRFFFNTFRGCVKRECLFLHVPCQSDEKVCMSILHKLVDENQTQLIKRAVWIFTTYYRKYLPGIHYDPDLLTKILSSLYTRHLWGDVFNLLENAAIVKILPSVEMLIKLFENIAGAGLRKVVPSLVEVFCKLVEAGMVLKTEEVNLLITALNQLRATQNYINIILDMKSRIESQISNNNCLCDLDLAVEEIKHCKDKNDWCKLGTLYLNVRSGCGNVADIKKFSSCIVDALKKESKEDKCEIPYLSFANKVWKDPNLSAVDKSTLGRIGISMMYYYHQNELWQKGMQVLRKLCAIKIHFTVLKGLTGEERQAPRCQIVNTAVEIYLKCNNITGALRVLRESEWIINTIVWPCERMDVLKRHNLLCIIVEETLYKNMFDICFEVLQNLPGFQNPNADVDVSQYSVLFNKLLRSGVENKSLGVSSSVADFMIAKKIPIDFFYLRALITVLGKCCLWLRARIHYKSAVSLGCYPPLEGNLYRKVLHVPSFLSEVEMLLAIEIFMVSNASSIQSPGGSNQTLQIVLKRSQEGRNKFKDYSGSKDDYQGAVDRLTEASRLSTPRLSIKLMTVNNANEQVYILDHSTCLKWLHENMKWAGKVWLFPCPHKE